MLACHHLFSRPTCRFVFLSYILISDDVLFTNEVFKSGVRKVLAYDVKKEETCFSHSFCFSEGVWIFKASAQE